MRIYDIIMKKRDGNALDDAELAYFVDGATSGEIPDYQVSALLMAIWFRGMNEHETAVLTDRMAHSGDMVDLSAIPGIKVDKHSTGGVGDKTTLIVAPVVAACGVPVAKMSGRGLGHTGGTVDKLEAIPGFKTSIERERFFEIVRETGLSVIGQTGSIAPADKKLYALRDVTATVDSLPLIASSIMSKKLAAGSDAIVLDVKTGGGAFMKTLDDSIALAKAMVSIGEHNGRRMSALITDMDIPLGHAIGNSLEVIEAMDVLCGRGPADLTEVSLRLAADMLFLADKGTEAECLALAQDAIASGRAFERLRAMTAAQAGDTAVLDDAEKFPKAPVISEVKAERGGYVSHMDTERCGIASVVLGAGRESKDDTIDMSAGIMLLKKTGDQVQAGEVLARLYTSDADKLAAAGELLLSAYSFSEQPPKKEKLVLARVTKAGVEKF